jgi:hypothetical protein
MLPIVCKLPHKTLTEVPKSEENGVRFRVPDVYCHDMHTLSLEETINTWQQIRFHKECKTVCIVFMWNSISDENWREKNIAERHSSIVCYPLSLKYFKKSRNAVVQSMQ